MIKRLRIYFREMYPLIPRLFLGFLIFFEIYFLTILTNGKGAIEFSVGVPEIVGSITVFAFLLSLRIADDFKDYELDKRLFPERPLPSGRVTKKDLSILLTVVVVGTSVMNFIFLNNTLFYLILFAYGLLMSLWFFQKYKIQSSLLLALVTHNPVQIILNLYVISYACKKYGIPLLTLNNVLIALTLYFPGLIWEISRKIRAPEQETEYVTYSKLFGYKKPVYFIIGVMFLDLLSTSILVYQLYPWAVATVLIAYIWLVWQCVRFIKDPSSFRLVDKVEKYEYAAEISVVFFIVASLLGWWK